ncbi:ABC transporter ATP-binding protein [Roseomonas sp. 18066]|uniref:ABC transporter ATP-binding protein n=1 Tax=Roseomonas sp. 18066 TaxID=2681412 RepID=UPI00190FBDB2|nr:ABC transporter ATP-binding protein [Roseomonas sp. 18066]
MSVAPLEARGLGFRHPGAARPVFAGLQLALRPGRPLTILGPNGVGKSTLLRCLAGLAKPGEGAVLLGGTPVAALDDAARARRLAFMAQSEAEAFAFTAGEIVLTGRAAHLGLFQRPGAADRARAAAALRRLGIAHLAPRPMTALSGGEQQMVRLARALAQAAPVLLLDEPTAHLDLANQRQVLDVVRALAAEGLAVAMSSHDPSHALACGGEVLLLGRDGAVAGPVGEVIRPDLLRRAYGLPIEILRSGFGQAVAVPDFGAPAGPPRAPIGGDAACTPPSS